MRYKVRSVGALKTILSSLPNRTQVEVDPDIEIHAKTVGDLRKLTVAREFGDSNAARMAS